MDEHIFSDILNCVRYNKEYSDKYYKELLFLELIEEDSSEMIELNIGGNIKKYLKKDLLKIQYFELLFNFNSNSNSNEEIFLDMDIEAFDNIIQAVKNPSYKISEKYLYEANFLGLEDYESNDNLKLECSKTNYGLNNIDILDGRYQQKLLKEHAPDIYFTGNPQVTFHKIVYKRCTKYLQQIYIQNLKSIQNEVCNNKKISNNFDKINEKSNNTDKLKLDSNIESSDSIKKELLYELKNNKNISIIKTDIIKFINDENITNDMIKNLNKNLTDENIDFISRNLTREDQLLYDLMKDSKEVIKNDNDVDFNKEFIFEVSKQVEFPAYYIFEIEVDYKINNLINCCYNVEWIDYLNAFIFDYVDSYHGEIFIHRIRGETIYLHNKIKNIRNHKEKGNILYIPFFNYGYENFNVFINFDEMNIKFKIKFRELHKLFKIINNKGLDVTNYYDMKNIITGKIKTCNVHIVHNLLSLNETQRFRMVRHEYIMRIYDTYIKKLDSKEIKIYLRKNMSLDLFGFYIRNTNELKEEKLESTINFELWGDDTCFIKTNSKIANIITNIKKYSVENQSAHVRSNI